MMDPFKRLKTVWIKYALAVACLTVPVVGNGGAALAQTIEFQAEASEIYAGMPFQLSVILKDVEESPQPEIEPFTIENAQVSFVGVMPSIRSMMSIVNGKYTSKVEVKYVFTYNVVPESVGHYVLPTIRARQGSKEIVSRQRVSFDAADVQSSRDMRIELELPDRALWVGESFDAYINWYVRKEFSTHDFSIPILSLGDYFDIADADPTVDPNLRHVIPVVSGGRQYLFPYTRDKATVGGVDYTRFRIRVGVTPIREGEVRVPATSVRAKLESGMTRDSWGFPVQKPYQLYKAEDVERALVVKSLPSDQRPESFSNALGTQFDIAVQADRTIVRVGDPIILTIDISSPKGMDGLILPSLLKSGLSEALFGVSEDSPLPETIDTGTGRVIQRFKVPIRVRSERVREIPPIAFSYFDLKRESYVTVRSQPIALTVTASEKVSAEDVVMNAATAGAMAAGGNKADGETKKAAKPASFMTNSGLELGLETPAVRLDMADVSRLYRVGEAVAYALPFLCWLGLWLVRRSRRRSALDRPQREAVLALKAALSNARMVDAKTAASQISNALTAFCVETGTDKKQFMDILEQIDAEAYRPGAGNTPVKAALVDALHERVVQKVSPRYTKLVTGLLGAMFALGIVLSLPQPVMADAPRGEIDAPGAVAAADSNGLQHPADDAARLQEAQTAYHEAMKEASRSEQVARFSYSAAVFRDLAKKYPHQAALYMDWGNAAFNASDMGSASLAWRRALMLDPTLQKARNNLAYIDSLQDFGQKKKNAALSSFFFLNDKVTPSQRLLWASLFFLVAAMLCVPWSLSHKRALRIASVLPFLVWLWLLASVGMQNDRDGDAVVMHETSLKNADNSGAASVLPFMLEPGVLVEIVQERESWVSVRLPNGVQGWLLASSVERVAGER